MKAIIIGGSGTIGRAITHDLLSNGYEVIVTYHQTPLATLMDEFQGQPVQFVQLDLSQPVNLEEKLSFVRNLDALIYASGHSLFGMLQDMTDTDIHEAYQVHVFHFIKMTQYFVNQLIQSPHGRIVAISSIWGETGASFETIYSSMKAAQIGFVKSLAKELARTSVTVNAIAPGVVAGSMTDALDHEARVALLKELPQNRWVDPNEIAHATRFLLSPLSQSVTGTVQRINGGWYC
ncbi:elongation factor P 5-aminopentanone reductase [Staphylococcus delphini]|uniref:elongation factor P 5-aminopentanone reductase n=1 Tax=Staphylococcus delphini TaxID=53344 RepID=UPI0023B23E0D|nr:SDR family oxidoreductase [Staphylococcus delphini]MDE9798415.1 SDR family oxidoreductase [Staphylococcus delphini]MDE9805656.1 SDR family oxidoreductase [Staphylococcus delphini]